MDIEEFEIRLEEEGITTLNPLYAIVDSNTASYEEFVKMWNNTDITELQYNLITNNSELAKQVIRKAIDAMYGGYGSI